MGDGSLKGFSKQLLKLSTCIIQSEESFMVDSMRALPAISVESAHIPQALPALLPAPRNQHDADNFLSLPACLYSFLPLSLYFIHWRHN